MGLRNPPPRPDFSRNATLRVSNVYDYNGLESIASAPLGARATCCSKSARLGLTPVSEAQALGENFDLTNDCLIACLRPPSRNPNPSVISFLRCLNL
jgi:hypothetical protein